MSDDPERLKNMLLFKIPLTDGEIKDMFEGFTPSGIMVTIGFILGILIIIYRLIK